MISVVNLKGRTLIKVCGYFHTIRYCVKIFMDRSESLSRNKRTKLSKVEVKVNCTYVNMFTNKLTD